MLQYFTFEELPVCHTFCLQTFGISQSIGRKLGVESLGSLVPKPSSSAIIVPVGFVLMRSSGAPSNTTHFGGSRIQLPGTEAPMFPFVCMPWARDHSRVSLGSLLCYAAPSIFKASQENLPLTL